ncbi:MAG: hypothetical protein H6738_25700 [Alphaproteobacteria bacterium]|nr:hypothetical protein [Alphaproteobacteria bacterium]
MWSSDVWEGREPSGWTERDWLGAPRRQLGRSLAVERTDGTVVAWGRAGAFGQLPDGVPGTFVAGPAWALAEADVVWCDHAFGRVGGLELLSALREAVRPGTLVAVVDVAEVASDHVRTWLADTLDLSPAHGVRAALPQLFTPLASGAMRQTPGWTSFTFLGRRR